MCMYIGIRVCVIISVIVSVLAGKSWWLRTSFVLLSVAISQLLGTSMYLAISIACNTHVHTN